MTISTCPIFSSRETLEEAIEYSTELIGSLPREHQIAAMTALWVSLNTALLQIEKVKLPPFASIKPESDEVAAKRGQFKVAELPIAEAAQLVRNELPYAVVNSYKLAKIFPDMGADFTTVFLALARLYGLSADDVIAEIQPILRGKGTQQ